MITAWDFPVGKREPWNFLLESGVLLVMLATLGRKTERCVVRPMMSSSSSNLAERATLYFDFFSLFLARRRCVCVFVCVYLFFCFF